MNIRVIAAREIKLGFRNPWAYSFLILFSFFTLSILLIQSQTQMEGYSHSTGSLLNLILYLLPLMTLLLGAFAVTAEKEEGGWQLLATYSLSGTELLLGKYVGLSAVLFTIVGFSFGLAAVTGVLVGRGFSLYSLAFFYMVSLLLVFVFLSIAVLLGTLVRNRWQALTIGIGLWFILILAWPTLLVAGLGMLPYPMIKPVLQALVYLNPAELIRIFMITRIGGGSSFGPEYYNWVQWLGGYSGLTVFLVVCIVWVFASLGAAAWVWERRRQHD